MPHPQSRAEQRRRSQRPRFRAAGFSVLAARVFAAGTRLFFFPRFGFFFAFDFFFFFFTFGFFFFARFGLFFFRFAGGQAVSREEAPQRFAGVEVPAGGGCRPAVARLGESVESHPRAVEACFPRLLGDRSEDLSGSCPRAAIGGAPLFVDLGHGRLVAHCAERIGAAGIAFGPAAAAPSVIVSGAVYLVDADGVLRMAGDREVLAGPHIPHARDRGEFAGQAVGHVSTQREAGHVDAAGIDVGARHEMVDHRADEFHVSRAGLDGIAASDVPVGSMPFRIGHDEALLVGERAESCEGLPAAGVVAAGVQRDHQRRPLARAQVGRLMEEVCARDAPRDDRLCDGGRRLGLARRAAGGEADAGAEQQDRRGGPAHRLPRDPRMALRTPASNASSRTATSGRASASASSARKRSARRSTVRASKSARLYSR